MLRFAWQVVFCMPVNRLGLIALFICFCDLMTGAPAQARPEWLSEGYLLDRWTNADGLPVNGTTDVLMGKHGYLWVATFDGLVRFDGHRFKTYSAGSHPGLPGNRLTRLIQQDNGLIWLLTEQYALASFDGREFHAAGTEQGLPAPRVLKLHLDRRDRLWLGTEQGLAHACGGACFQSVGESALQGEAVQAFADAPEGGIWAGTGTGRVIRAGIGGVEQILNAEDGIALRDVRALAVDSDGVVFAGGQGGLVRIEGNKGRMLRLFEGKTVNDLEFAPGGELIVQSYERTWRSSDDGWRVVNEGPIAGYVRLVADGPHGSEWRVRQYDLLENGESVVRAPCPIRDFAFDSTGGVWLATLCDGLWRVSQRRFDTITTQHGLPEGPVYGMAQGADGTIWASVGAGALAEIRGGVVRGVHAAGSPGQVVGTVTVTRQGRVLVGQGGFCTMQAGECEVPERLPRVLGNVLVRSIFEDRSGGLWIGSQTGVWLRYDGRWRSMQEALALPEWVQVQTVYQAESGSLWFGTDSDGLRRRSPGGEVLAFGRGDGLSSDRIRDLYQDSSGHLWVVTADSGVCRSDRREHRPGLVFDCLDSRQGLYADSLHRLLADGKGRFWFNSNSGVFWLHRQSLERVLEGRAERVYSRVFTESDGLPDREGNGGVQNAGIRLLDGRLAFPGQGGIAIFDPGVVEEHQGAPRVIIQQLRLADGTALPAGNRVELPLGERVFSVQITGIKPGLTGEIYFRYRFDDGSWMEVGEDRNLGFDNVRAGRHRLEIAAVDANSGLSGPVASMDIEVPPHLYERTSVRVASIGAIVLLAAVWLARRHRAAIRLQQYLHREVDRRTSQVLRERHRADAAVAIAGERSEGAEASTAESAVATATTEPLLADDVRTWIERNVQHGGLSVAALAESMHMSRSKLHRRLVRETGRSPGEFIRDVRLGLARQMLQGDGRSVSDVAYSVGFSSVSGFSRAYRNHFGESPSQTGSE
ncbi:AraC family transcriptional regulator [Wenzhouxiangella sediminis]|uniref:Helix-turn-helix domain-containing protein n=1 Tax=Wenzhouxiangella sediminis TaxID=1792836 RepID=A0A3E1K5A5_9GAMM|nr:AraC family transcriptional regulator [Wenzhouxiangella sediminis]RFF29201.1 helix-turn-helix domain-containing protein [Wenzhouxiangella sediminis]